MLTLICFAHPVRPDLSLVNVAATFRTKDRTWPKWPARNSRHFRRCRLWPASPRHVAATAIRTASQNFAAAMLKKLAARRYGREVECTALEMWHERKP